MKGTFFNKPLEWNIETQGESWQQGSILMGNLKVKNHGQELIDLTNSGVGLSHAEIKKVHARAAGALKLEATLALDQKLKPGEELSIEFSFPINANALVSDKRGSYYLCFGKDFLESQLQLKIEPRVLFTKVLGLLETFHRFKVKEFKAAKKGVEYKLIPPTSRDMANIETLLLTFSVQADNLSMNFDFQVKKLDTSSVTTKINKDSVSIEKVLSPREYSLGKDLINQDQLLKTIEAVIAEVKMKSVF